MLDFRCLIIPRFVYAVGSRRKVTDEGVNTRIGRLADELERLRVALT